MDNTKPIFITGTQRSGSSWVAHILTTGNNVALIDEPFNQKKRFPVLCSATFPHMFTYLSDHNGLDFYKEIAGTLNYQGNIRLNLQHINIFTLRGAYRLRKHLKVLNNRRKRHSRPLIKQPTGIFMAEWLAEHFNMHVIVLIRHPAAYVSSRKRLGWEVDFSEFLAQRQLMKDHLGPLEAEIRAFTTNQHDTIEQLSFLWRIIYSKVLVYQSQYPDWIFLRLEDIACEPLEQFRTLCYELDIYFSNDLRAEVLKTSSSANPAEVPVEGWKSLMRNSKASITTWKQRLTPEEIARVRDQVEVVSGHFYSDDDW